MDLKQYYNFPDGANVKLQFTPHFWGDKENFSFSGTLDNMFYEYKGVYVPQMDVTNATSMSKMFYYCNNLIYINGLDKWKTSNVTNMSNMFYYTKMNKLITDGFKYWDVSKVTNMESTFSNSFGNSAKTNKLDISNWDTSNVKTMKSLFDGCTFLKEISSIRADSVTDIYPSYSGLFGYSTMEYLTDFGGLINLKCSTGEYCFPKCPNLNYQSCINILNGLFDFNSAGVTPSSNQGKLKVHANFLALVGDEISIGTNKGWTITA